MNDIKEAITERIKSPYIGYAAISFILLNWRGFFALSATKGTPEVRLAAFDSLTSYQTLFVYPLLIGIFIVILSPWIKWGLKVMSETPLVGLKVSEQKEVELFREELTKLDRFFLNRKIVQEQQVLNETKVNEELDNITDQAKRDEASSKIAAIRENIEIEKSKAISRLKAPANFTATFSSKDSAFEQLVHELGASSLSQDSLKKSILESDLLNSLHKKTLADELLKTSPLSKEFLGERDNLK